MIKIFSKVAKELNNDRLSKQMADVLDYHTTPVQAAEIAKEAGVKKLVIVHITPPILNYFAKKMYLEGTEKVFKGDIILGEDGMSFILKPKQ